MKALIPLIAAWGEGGFPYLYQNRPDANFDPAASMNLAWDLYREMTSPTCSIAPSTISCTGSAC